jgi:DNA-binding GntR family transcriptional regulator
MNWDEFALDEDLPRYLYEQVADHIVAVIDARNLEPGAMLPGEQSLAVMLGVSVGTVRRATDELRQRDIVVTLPAKGTFVTRRPGGEQDA